MKPILYLAGPITGQTYAGCNDWRDDVRARLWPLGIDARSPMRGKAFLEDGNGVIGGKPTEEYTRHAMASPAGVLCRDRNDVRTAGAMLAVLTGANRVSIGTMVEFGWADAYRVPIITVMNQRDGDPHFHMFVTQLSGYVVETLDEALNIACVLLAPPAPYPIPNTAFAASL